MNERENAIEHFRSRGVHLSPRKIGDKSVFGVQCRDRHIFDEDLRHLSALRDKLDVIGLEGTRITDEGLHHLTALPHLDNVDLTNTGITDTGLQVLATIKTLEFVHLEGTKVTATGVAMLRDAVPKCEVVWDGD